MSIEISYDMSDLHRKGIAFERDLRKLAVEDLDAAGREVLAHLNSGEYYQRRTGDMANKLGVRKAGELSRQVRAASRHAVFLQNGTKPHLIAARKKKSLFFVWHGVACFFRAVNHPGTKPTHFVEGESAFLEAFLPPALDKSAGEAIRSSGIGLPNSFLGKTMSGHSSYLEAKILNWIKGTAFGTAPTSVYVALYTTMPADDNTGGVEVSGTGYARQAVTFGALSAASPGQQMSSSATANFGTAGSAWGTVTGFGILDASTAGNLLYSNTLTGGSQTISSGNQVSFASGALTLKDD